MTLTSTYLDAVMRSEHRFWRCAIRLQVTAGWGCTVLEIFALHDPQPSVPLRRILL